MSLLMTSTRRWRREPARRMNNAPEAARSIPSLSSGAPEPGEGIRGVVTEGLLVPAVHGRKARRLPNLPGWVPKIDGATRSGQSRVARGAAWRNGKAAAQVGDRVAVLYSGVRTGQSRHEYNHYALPLGAAMVHRFRLRLSSEARVAVPNMSGQQNASP